MLFAYKITLKNVRLPSFLLERRARARLCVCVRARVCVHTHVIHLINENNPDESNTNLEVTPEVIWNSFLNKAGAPLTACMTGGLWDFAGPLQC